MDLISLLLPILLAAAGVLLAGAGYFLLYRWNVNRALAAPDRRRLRLPAPCRVLAALAAALVLASLALVIAQLSGPARLTDAGGIERDVRQSQNVGSDWTVEIGLDGRAAAVLAYDPRKEEHVFSVYVNDGGTRPDYVFRYGGKSTSIQRGIRAFELEGATALISMNALGIAAVESHGGARYEVAPDRPFAIVIPGGGYDLYDSAGDLIDPARSGWFERTQVR